jgi:hypothetical protein
MIKATESVVVSKMGEGYSVRASWHDNTKNIIIKEKDKAKLTTVVDNLFLERDGQRAGKDVYNERK